MEGGGTPDRMDVIGAAAPPPEGRRQLTHDKPRPTYDIRPENARMFVIDSADSTSLKGVNPFIIQKAIDGFVGKVEFAKKIASGSILVRVNSASQARNILKMTKLHSFDVKVSVHAGLNTCKGVITCRDLQSLEEKEIVECMKDQNVVDAKFITRLRDGVRERTWSVILTFGLEKVPEHVFIGYERVSCRVYIPLPLRCFKCQKFGHGANKCNSLKVFCGKCSGEHDSADCDISVPKCVNCSLPHASNSRDCPKFKLEKEIVAYRAKERVDYFEARKIVLRELGSTSTPNLSYAAAVVNKPTVTTVSCQTEFYWVTTTAPSTSPPTAVLPVSKPATVSCSTNTVSDSESLSPIALSSSLSPSFSSVVVEPTRQPPKVIDNISLLTELDHCLDSHILSPTPPSWSASQGASAMDELVSKAARGRSKSPEDKAAGGRRSSLSPSGDRSPTLSPVSKKNKTHPTGHKPR